MQIRLNLQADGASTLVKFTMTYAMKYGIIGTLMNRTMTQPQFEKLIDDIMGGLKHFGEIGRSVQAGFGLATAVA